MKGERERRNDLTTVDESRLAVWGGSGVVPSLRALCAGQHMTEQQNARSHAHLPEEVRHHHVWKGLGPSGDLGGQKRAGLDRRRLSQQPDRVSKPHCPGAEQRHGLPRIQVWGHPRDGRWSPVSSYLRGLEPWQTWPGPPSIPYSQSPGHRRRAESVSEQRSHKFPAFTWPQLTESSARGGGRCRVRRSLLLPNTL